MAHTKQDSAVRQASKLLDVTYIVPMEVEEARRHTDAIRSNLVEACERLLEMYERQGWKALGYSSWREWAQTELNLSKTRGYELLSFGKVRRNLKQLPNGNSAIAEKVPDINEAQARKLAKVPAEKQREVYQEAVASVPAGVPTAKQVALIVERRYPVTRPAPKPVTSGKRSISGRMDTRTRCKGLLDQASDSLVEEIYLLLSERLEGVS